MRRKPQVLSEARTLVKEKKIDDPVVQKIIRELPSDTPMDLIQHFTRIDKLLEEAKYALAEKKFEEAQEKRLQEKAIKEVKDGKSSSTRRKKRGQG